MSAYPETLSCICCGAPLPNIMIGRGIQPMGGLAFLSQGHFGSSVFDPMDGSSIQIVLCDPCLSKQGWYSADRPRPANEKSCALDSSELSPEMLVELEKILSGGA